MHTHPCLWPIPHPPLCAALHVVALPYVEAMLEMEILKHNHGQVSPRDKRTRAEALTADIPKAVDEGHIKCVSEEQLAEAEADTMRWAVNDSTCTVLGQDHEYIGPWELECDRRTNLKVPMINQLHAEFRPTIDTTSVARLQEQYLAVKAVVYHLAGDLQA